MTQQAEWARVAGYCEEPFPDSANVNHTLVKDGWFWWYRKYAPGNTTLEQLESDARAGKRGLWADLHPVPPWEWRHRK